MSYFSHSADKDSNMLHSSFQKTVQLFTIVIFALVTSPSFTMAKEGKWKVIESLKASGYTYLHLEDQQQKIWVAIPEQEVKKDDVVRFKEGLLMKDFFSKTLNKTFEEIFFSPGLLNYETSNSTASNTNIHLQSNSFTNAVTEERHKIQASASSTITGSGGSSSAVVPSVETQVIKADGTNGFCIEEIFSKVEELHGKQVRVRGKVVKFSPNIMGKNWIHIQDGSGDPMKNSHDLVITTNEKIALNDIVLMEGKVTANKDFGFGYKYEVLLEDASVVQ